MEAETQPTGWLLDREMVNAWLDRLIRDGRRVVTPVERDGLRVFREIAGAEQACLAPGKTQWSPKEYLFPRSEPLFRYEVRGNEVTLIDPPAGPPEQVLFGLRPCDAAGLARLDAMLGRDSLYADRRARTTLVAIACAAPEPECFCTAVGGAPDAIEGSDLLLTQVGEDWLVRPVTARGDVLVADAAAGWPAAPAEAWTAAREQGRLAAEGVTRSPIAREWAEGLEARFDDPAWNTVSRRCVGCSICTSVCPSCSCFNVEDQGCAGCGVRCRSWDSCSFALFTLHTSGHNPRPDQASRFRQRVLHKFSYFPLTHDGRPMCVGCGRCIRLCPVGLDIHQAVRAVMEGAQEAGHAG